MYTDILTPSTSSLRLVYFGSVHQRGTPVSRDVNEAIELRACITMNTADPKNLIPTKCSFMLPQDEMKYYKLVTAALNISTLQSQFHLVQIIDLFLLALAILY